MVLEVNESKVTVVAGRRSRTPHLGAANMRRGIHKCGGAAVRQVVGA
jgi:hypothetical protein